MQPSPGNEPSQYKPAPTREPSLLINWSSGRQIFFENLADSLFLREPAQPKISARPAPFWSDVFVSGGLPWLSFARSAAYHALAAGLVWALTLTWIQRTQVKTHSPFENTKITYYSVSEYLPEIDTGSAPAKKERKGAPKQARQRIISLPPAPDNFRQTIVGANNIKLPADVSLPNIVAWTPVPSPVPEAAMIHSPSQLSAPALPVSVVAPPPETHAVASRLPAVPVPDVIAPAPTTEGVRSRMAAAMPVPEVVAPPPSTASARSRVRLPYVPEPAVIQPPVTASEAKRPLGAMSVARFDPVVTPPKLPVPEQRVASAGTQGSANSAGSGAQQAVAIPAAPAVAGMGDGKRVAGQLIALGINPSDVVGAIVVPNGSRAGEFAAAPEGHPEAPGTPEIKGGGIGTGGSGPHPNGNGAPPGISVGPAPAAPAMVASAAPLMAAPPPAVRNAFNAALAATRTSTNSLHPRPSSSVTEPAKIEDKVFAGKKYYSMTLNMPNLTSSSGSWVIRFAELNESPIKSEVTAPVAKLKVDPAYPAELIRDGVEGTVTLYAVIHRDGSVGEVRVLRGVEKRLDHNALIALSRWIFRPGTKNGTAVDLEAVVQIPFHARKFPF